MTPVYPALMIDIEALGKEPGGEHCLILSTAAVPFNPLRRHALEGRAWKLSPVGQEKRAIDEDTVRWWLAQSEVAIAASFGGRTRPVNFLMEFASYAKSVCCDGFEAWANGPTYDLVALTTMYQEHGLARPWKYNAARDLRTLWGLAPGLRRPSRATHDPIDDCLEQIKIVWEIHEKLGLLTNA